MRLSFSVTVLSTLAPALLAGCAAPQHSVLTRFEATLAAQDSATAALEHWCAERQLAEPAQVVAQPASGHSEPSAESRELLEVGPDLPVGYRHVRLTCGGQVLSDAHNWYVPSRLTAEMNHALETSDAPFGKVVSPLGFKRERLGSQRGASEACPADTILSHRALLRLPDGRPISLVIECYTPANLR